MISFLIYSSFSWTPAFHQGFALKYAETYFPNITNDQLNSFLLGAMYADGVDKSISHYVRPVISELNAISDTENNLYWFFLGVLNHISVDTFAHAGKEKSFITASGLWHHISELTICSWAQTNLRPSFRLITRELKQQIEAIGIRFRTSFKFLYPICYLLTKFPFHYIMLPLVQKDGCPKHSYRMSECNFLKHFNAMMKATKEIMDHALDTRFNEIDVKQITLAELQSIECCGNRIDFSINIGDHFPNDQEFPFLLDTRTTML